MGSLDHSHACWADRRAAGEELAERLRVWQGQGATTTVVALPRGGVAVAAVIAQRLALPITTWAVRKLALPTNPEFAIGAIAPGDVVLWDPTSSRGLMLYPDLRRLILERETRELQRRQQRFGDAAPGLLRGRRLIVVDDGIATGHTLRAALHSLRQLAPQRLILAVPVASRRGLEPLRPLLDEAVVLAVLDELIAVGCHYRRFEQLSDADVLSLLEDCRRPAPATPA